MNIFSEKKVRNTENVNRYLISQRSLKKIFDEVDQDNNGTISNKELCDFLIVNENDLSRGVIKEVHKRADQNGDNQLDFEEFENMVNDPKNTDIFGSMLDKYISVVLPKQQKQESKYNKLYSCWPLPFLMVTISLVEAICFTIDAYLGNVTGTGYIAQYVVYDPEKRLEVWRYFTYMFAHVGYAHVIMNVLIQIFFGIPIEMVHGWWRVLLIYLAGVLGGSLGTSVLSPNVKLAGASGGVYSLITGQVAIVILNWRDMDYPLTNLMIVFAFTIANIEHIPCITVNNLSHTTHFCGALAGLLVGITIMRNVKVTRGEKTMQRIALILYIFLMNVCIIWNIATYHCQQE